ncbi:MAG: bifunctional folylpolyglutamate synthase/dihydrofolate synthase [Muribaculum sp.]|nr:bifunctional folylpolyglutamate synthase/dihydrofolate synthase [Muribaculum sp.]
MTYNEATDFLFIQLPMFQNIGPGAYKPGLDTTLALSERFGNPHRRLRVIHVGGTNGKGSTSHSLAAVMQSAGYRTGLFTSPHLVDFRERIRVNGEMIPESRVIDFVERYMSMADNDLHPTFFELTTVMAMEYFASCGVDVAIIEVGLGGRLDSTNIVIPELSVITNISYDHTALLGDTLPEIAAEKAGIIKYGVPVVIGEAEGEVRKVFERRAAELSAPIVFASDRNVYTDVSENGDSLVYTGTCYGKVECDLSGDCQPRNFATVMCAINILVGKGWKLSANSVVNGLKNVCSITGLMGRWMILNHSPLTVCDTGHNEGGWRYLAPRIARHPGRRHVVVGFVNDKDIDTILSMMPVDNTRYYFTQASVRRALPAEQLRDRALQFGLHGEVYSSVAEAYRAALNKATDEDMIYVGGSTFIVADLLAELN